MQNLIDTHFHLDMYKDYNYLFRYINQEKQYTLCMTNSPGIFLSCKRIFNRSKYVKFALGFHPLNMKLRKKDFIDFLYLLSETNYVGEIGLDFTKKNRIPNKEQVYYFKKIVEICSKENKLMSVHIRGAEEEALEIIDRYRPKRCILHWYTGNIEYQKKFIDLGCYFSINASMLKNVEVVNSIPRDKLLVESDGPYSKVRGKRFSPQLLREEYECIAKTLSEPEIIKLIYSNFYKLLMIH
ncbi:TatD family hydrolase [Clostridium sp. MSJ-8]|uniref:TatD family hydrolase n=1 Tax=Clostridium sp. MSJ-8 TaxID=2841510 RepID=UPI001C0F36EB|nr:TatD family hydrolase [Clostridium sp. MSJ-8]MBU5486569.1 TatD family hydrolase [Clostridium sp. MSJ-8]